jgi:hypothetical protein
MPPPSRPGDLDRRRGDRVAVLDAQRIDRKEAAHHQAEQREAAQADIDAQCPAALDQEQQHGQGRARHAGADGRHRDQVEVHQHHLADGHVGAPARADEDHGGEGAQHLAAPARHRRAPRS